MENRNLFGRTMITSNVDKITTANVIDVLSKAAPVHATNRDEIDYLYRYYKGDQPILYREKDVRPEINNKIVENRAMEIVSFKLAYQVGEPVQYVSRGDDPDIADKVTRLNDYMLSEDKASEDEELVEWGLICGTGYRITLPDATADVEADEAPFESYSLDPRDTFVVYQTRLGHPPLMGVTYVTRTDPNTQQPITVYGVYTDDRYFEIENNGSVWEITKDIPQMLGIPIVEYPLNTARLGAFEPVIPLLNAINLTDSDRVNGVDQFIQALMLFHNVRLDSEQYKKLREEGAIQFADIDQNTKAEISYLTAELNQTQTQTLVDHMYNVVLTICGMPNRNGGSSTSDTGAAVEMRDGWSAAEARAKRIELMFKKSEKKFLKTVLRICRDLSDLDLKMSSVEIRFTRRNYENIATKVSVLVQMLSSGKIAPQLAFATCGLFPDPNIAYTMSKEYCEEEERKLEEKQKKMMEQGGGPNGGQRTDPRGDNGGKPNPPKR